MQEQRSISKTQENNNKLHIDEKGQRMTKTNGYKYKNQTAKQGASESNQLNNESHRRIKGIMETKNTKTKKQKNKTKENTGNKGLRTKSP